MKTDACFLDSIAARVIIWHQFFRLGMFKGPKGGRGPRFVLEPNSHFRD